MVAIRNKHRAGFTLIELMVVVAIIGLISAIAVPSFLRYQLRAKRSEAYANLAAISKAEEGYYATNGVYYDTGNAFPGGVGPTKRQWTAAAEAGFGPLGFRPEGNVFFDYDANTVAGCACALCYTATAYGDVDGDGAIVALMYVRPDGAGGVCTSGLLGFGTPVENGTPIVNQVSWNATADDF